MSSTAVLAASEHLFHSLCAYGPRSFASDVTLPTVPTTLGFDTGIAFDPQVRSALMERLHGSKTVSRSPDKVADLPLRPASAGCSLKVAAGGGCLIRDRISHQRLSWQGGAQSCIFRMVQSVGFELRKRERSLLSFSFLLSSSSWADLIG